jgi:hypothetical protein
MKKIILLFLSVGFFALFSCKKNTLGGKSSIDGKVVHHTKRIANARVFIKSNATEFPGKDTLVYDSKLSADENGNFTFSVYKGDYYLYAYGYDFAIPQPYLVEGGTAVKARNNEKVNLTLAVTED